jgi:very-long-chain ceramide synthase
MSESFQTDFAPQTPIGTPERQLSPPPPPRRRKVSPWLAWAIRPSASLKVLLVPLVLYVNWQLLPWSKHMPNPFAPFFLLSQRVPDSTSDDPRYAKGYYDVLFIAYYVVFFSLVRQLITINLCRPIARWFGIRKEGKLDRFGEQGYAFLYFTVMGAWGYVSCVSLFVPVYSFLPSASWANFRRGGIVPSISGLVRVT